MKVLDLFSGCGGLSLGFQNASFEIVGGIDFDKDCIDTYQLNFPKSKTFVGDVSKFDKSTIIKNFKDVDVIIGGPPCQGFSSANMWEKNKKYDYRNYLFRDFIRFVELINPKIAVIENVSRILTIEDGKIKKGIENQFNELGYKINNKVLTASDYGVPQKRKRNFFVATRNEYDRFDFELMKKKDVVNVGDALSDLYALENQSINFNTITSKILSDYQKIMRSKNNEIYNHNPKYPMEKVQERIRHVKEGENWKAVPENLWDTVRHNRHSSAYKRLNSNDISITIDCGHMNYFHPKFDRVPTVRESARIQSFPDSFKFNGKQGSQFSQVGNAVPPLLAESLAIAIKGHIWQ
tara:strand:- start:3030 stop:4082 length:1053 start_codon:yes stop_codon:yes gene_type:complete